MNHVNCCRCQKSTFDQDLKVYNFLENEGRVYCLSCAIDLRLIKKRKASRRIFCAICGEDTYSTRLKSINYQIINGKPHCSSCAKIITKLQKVQRRRHHEAR